MTKLLLKSESFLSLYIKDLTPGMNIWGGGEPKHKQQKHPKEVYWKIFPMHIF